MDNLRLAALFKVQEEKIISTQMVDTHLPELPIPIEWTPPKFPGNRTFSSLEKYDVLFLSLDLETN